jgi:hypothetical protein
MTAVRAVIAEEQKRDFRKSSLALSGGVWASATSALVLSFAILVVQLRQERTRIEREARLAKMRRLRYKVDGAEVMVRKLTPGAPKLFHIFLSHVWGYGCGAMILRARSAGWR